MKNQVLFVGILFSLFASVMTRAQGVEKNGMYVITDTINGKAVTTIYESKKVYENITETKRKNKEALLLKKAEFERKQREFLAQRISEINDKKGFRANYTEEALQREKESVAVEVAEKISKHNASIDAQIEFDKISNKLSNGEGATVIADFEDGLNIKIKNKQNMCKYIRTEFGFTTSFAYNFMNGENLGINDFSYANNNYFSAGIKWKTNLDKDKNSLKFLYGLEYQSHGTELNGNRFFTQGNQAQVAQLGFNAEKAKFRQDQLVIPLHLEIGGSKRKEYEDGRVRFDNSDYWKFGIGGFAGFNMSSRIKLKYDTNGVDIKEARIGNYDTEKFVYGLDAYVGHGAITFFGRMNLNKVFQGNSVDAQYVAFGIRLQ